MISLFAWGKCNSLFESCDCLTVKTGSFVHVPQCIPGAVVIGVYFRHPAVRW